MPRAPWTSAIVAALLLVPAATSISLGNATSPVVELGLEPGIGIDTELPGPSDPLVPNETDAPPVAGFGELDPWVDANGDKMFGTLNMGNNPVQFSNGALDGSSTGQGLRFAGNRLCTANVAIAGCGGGGGDITGVLAGAGLAGGGNSGDVSLSVNTVLIQNRVSGVCALGSSLRVVNEDGTVACEPDDDTTYTAGTGLSLTGTQFSVNPTAVQSRVTGACGPEAAVKSINQDGTVTCEPDTDTTYTAGTGLLLTGNSFSNTGDTNAADDLTTATTFGGDATGTYNNLQLGTDAVGATEIAAGGVGSSEVADASLLFADLAANGCSAGHVIKLSGGLWTCGTDIDTDTNSGGTVTSVTGGTGLTGGTITSSGTLAVNTATIQARVTGACAPGSSIATIASDGSVTCEPDTDTDTNSGGTVTSVASGPGLAGGPITSAGTLSIATGGVTSAMLADGTIALADLGLNGCTAGQVIKVSGSTWVCAADVDTDTNSGGTVTSVTGGTGLTGGTITSSGTLAVNTATIQARVTGACGPDASIKTVNADGTVLCEPDTDTTYTAGTGLVLTGNSFSNTGDTNPADDVLTTTAHAGDVAGTYDNLQLGAGSVGTGEIANGAVLFADLASNGCTANQVIKFVGGVWACAVDVDTDTDTLAALSCADLSVARWYETFTAWGCGGDQDLLATLSCTDASVVKRVGGAWDCGVDADTNSGGTVTSVASGTGLAGGPITGVGTLSIATGGVTSAMIADATIALADLGLNGCTAGQVIKVSGSTWVCAADVDTDTNSGGTVTSVASGSGLTGGPITGTGALSIATGGVTFPHIGPNGCAANQVMKRASDGSGWECAADIDTDTNSGGTVTSVASGAGLAGGPITGTGTLSIAAGGVTSAMILDGTVSGTDILDQSVGNADIVNSAVGSAKILDGGVATADLADAAVTTAKIADGTILFTDLAPNACTANQVLEWTGTVWACGTDDNTAYTAGTGISISGANVIANTGDTNAADDLVTATLFSGDVSGTYDAINIATGVIGTGEIADGSILLADVGTNGCTGNQVMKRNAGNTAWVCAADVDTNSGGTVTSVASGAGLMGGPITASGTIDLRLLSGGGLSKGLGPGLNELGITTNGIVTSMISGLAVTNAKIGTDAVDGSKVAAGSLALSDLGAAGCGSGDPIEWSGTAWACGTDSAGPSYNAGTGIDITGTTISNTGDTNAADDVLTTTSHAGDVTGVYSNLQLGSGVVTTAEIALDTIAAADIAPGAVGTSEILDSTILLADLAANGCTGNQVMKRNAGNTAWVCAVDVDTNSGGTVTSVASGAGLTGGPITGAGTLSIATGGVTSSMIADGTILFQDLSPGPCAGGMFMTFDGVDWDCNALVAGAGISISGAGLTIANTGDTNAADDVLTTTSHAGDVTGVYSNLQLGSGVVTTAEIALDTIAAVDIAAGAVGTSEILDSTILLADLAANGCTGNQVVKRNAGNTAWACAADVDTDTNSGGTVTSVASGAGLTGGPITGSGTLSIATGGVTSAMLADGTILFADMAQNGCAADQFVKWSGTAWVCGAAPPATDAQTLDGIDSLQFLRSDVSDSFTSGTLTIDSGTTLAVNGALKVGPGSSTNDDNILFDDGTVIFGWSEGTNSFWANDDLLVSDDLILGLDGASKLRFNGLAGPSLALDPVNGDFELSQALEVNGPVGAGCTAGALAGYNQLQTCATAAPTSGVLADADDLYVGDDEEVGGTLLLSKNLYMEGDAGALADGDQSIWFYDGGVRAAEAFRWVDFALRFELSDDLRVTGDVISTGDFGFTAARAFREAIGTREVELRDSTEDTEVRWATDGYIWLIPGAIDTAADLTAPVHVPQSATMTGLSCLYYDSSSTGGVAVTGELKSRPWTSTTISSEALASVTTSTTFTSTSVLTVSDSTITNPTVDNLANDYWIDIDMSSSAGSTLRFYGCYVGYTLLDLKP